jgi:hypothetical protein
MKTACEPEIQTRKARIGKILPKNAWFLSLWALLSKQRPRHPRIYVNNPGYPKFSANNPI